MKKILSFPKQSPARFVPVRALSWFLALVLAVPGFAQERIDSLIVEDLNIPTSGELTIATGAAVITNAITP